MPESMLLIEERAEEEFSRFKQKFHPHHDYLNLIIPSTWFTFWLVSLDFCFYHGGHLRAMLQQVVSLRSFFASASTSLEFFLSLFLFIIVFTIIYVVGQMINGFSAVFLDRMIVKKLLKYPFDLYLRRITTPPAIVDHEVLRSAMQESSYAIYCLNLVPIVFLEIVATLFSIEVTELPSYLQGYSRTHVAIAFAAVSVLVWLHFGFPSVAKARRSPEKEPVLESSLRLFYRFHWLFLVFLVLLEFFLVSHGWVWTILILPAMNLALGISERFVRSATSVGSQLRNFMNYLRACFTNPIYFAANVVGYGDFPSSVLIKRVRDEFAEDIAPKDFFWITYLTVQNRGGGASQTAYHFLATYGMVRNLCNATAFAMTVSVAAFLVRWPTGHGTTVIEWSLFLCALTYALFARYLYVYASYFSKYVLRAAAYVNREHLRAVAG